MNSAISLADRPIRGLALGRLLDVIELVRDAHVGIAAELDVGAAARHVGGDGDRAGHAGLGDDERLLLVEAGVQHGEDLGRLAISPPVERFQRVGLAKSISL